MLALSHVLAPRMSSESPPDSTKSKDDKPLVPTTGWAADDPKTVHQTVLHKFVFMRKEKKKLLTETETKSIIALNNLSFCFNFGGGNNSVVTLT